MIWIVIAIVIATWIVASAMTAFAFGRIAQNTNRTPIGMPTTRINRKDAA